MCEIINFTHVPGPFVQYSAESECSSARPEGIPLAQFSMLNNQLFNKDPDVVPQQAPLIILDGK